MSMNFRIFEGMFASWNTICGEAANFASSLAPGRVVSISHSCDQCQGVVIVWYWNDSAQR